MLPNDYPRDEEIRQCLFEALVDAMQNTSIDQLTISEITKKAHVSRSSFYRRYKDKYDLLNQSYERILERTLFTVHSGSSWRDAIYKIYKVIQENRRFFYHAFRSEDQNSLKKYIFNRTMRLECEVLRQQEINTDEKEIQYRLRGYVAGGLELTVRWVEEGADFPLDELVDILVEMVPESLKKYFP